MVGRFLRVHVRCYAHDWRLWMHLAGETPTKQFNLVSLKTPDMVKRRFLNECSKILCSSLHSSGNNAKVIPVLFDLQIKPKQKWKTRNSPCTTEYKRSAADRFKFNKRKVLSKWWFIIDLFLFS